MSLKIQNILKTPRFASDKNAEKAEPLKADDLRASEVPPVSLPIEALSQQISEKRQELAALEDQLHSRLREISPNPFENAFQSMMNPFRTAPLNMDFHLPSIQLDPAKTKTWGFREVLMSPGPDGKTFYKKETFGTPPNQNP